MDITTTGPAKGTLDDLVAGIYAAIALRICLAIFS